MNAILITTFGLRYKAHGESEASRGPAEWFLRGGKAAPAIRYEAFPITITIPLNLLRIFPLNARKTPPRAAEQAEFAAYSVAHGLLENLIVRPTDTEHYDVLVDTLEARTLGVTAGQAAAAS